MDFIILKLITRKTNEPRKRRDYPCVVISKGSTYLEQEVVVGTLETIG